MCIVFKRNLKILDSLGLTRLDSSIDSEPRLASNRSGSGTAKRWKQSPRLHRRRYHAQRCVYRVCAGIRIATRVADSCSYKLFISGAAKLFIKKTAVPDKARNSYQAYNGSYYLINTFRPCRAVRALRVRALSYRIQPPQW